MSRILAMDTSGPSLGVALLVDDRLVFACTQQNGLTHSDSLMPLVEQALQTGGLEAREIDCFAVTVGPGSFTGVRIGVATAKALAHATGARCVGVNALEALARGALPFGGIVCPLQDARAGQVYCAAFQQGQRLRPDAAEKLDAFLDSLPTDGLCCFAGDGAVAHRAAIAGRMGERAIFLPADRTMVQAGSVALLAAARMDEAVGWAALAPYYLRAPQAERERLARESKHGA